MSDKGNLMKDYSKPAFPVFVTATLQARALGEQDVQYQGMTLRDYFAAHAPEVPDMQTFPIKQWTTLEVIDLGNGMKGPRDVLRQESWAERSARWAAEYADAMLIERAA